MRGAESERQKQKGDGQAKTTEQKRDENGHAVETKNAQMW